MLTEPNERQSRAVAQWLRCCATNQKVAGSIPDGGIRIFHSCVKRKNQLDATYFII